MNLNKKKSMTIIAIVLILVGVFLLVVPRIKNVSKMKSSTSETPDPSIKNSYYNYSDDPIKYSYKDFDIISLETIPLTKEQERAKKESIEDGISGGLSMSSPTKVFKILAKDGSLIMHSSVEMLPYARVEFSVNGKDYTLYGNFEVNDENNVLLEPLP